MLMQILAGLLGVFSLILALLVQILDWLILTITDLAGLSRHALVRLSVFLRGMPPRK